MGLAGIDNARIIRKIGVMPQPEMQLLSAIIVRVLGLNLR
jgi:hypothetical protein